MAKPEPFVAGALVALVGEIGLLSVCNEEEVAEDFDAAALLAFSEQLRHRHIQELSQQVEQCRLDRGDCVDRRPEIEGLQSPAGCIAVCETVFYDIQNALV